MAVARPDWDTYFIAIALMASMKSTCLRRKMKAVVVRGQQIVNTGYNAQDDFHNRLFLAGFVSPDCGHRLRQ